MTDKTTCWVIFQEGRITDTRPRRGPHLAFEVCLTAAERAELQRLLDGARHTATLAEQNVHFLDALRLVSRHGSAETRAVIADSVRHVSGLIAAKT